MFGRDQDERQAGAKGGSKRSPAQRDALKKAQSARKRKPVAVVVESDHGTGVIVVRDWKKACKNCAEAQ